MLIKIDCDELWEWDNLTSNLNPILDPLTIIVRIIRRVDKDIGEIDSAKLVKSDKIKSSNLRSIGIIFFRHQHILIILVMIIIFIKFIFRFSTSKVDILINYLELLLMLLLILVIFFIRRVQPIVIVRRLIFITLVYSYYVYMVMGGYWFRYALMLVMLRGVLVLFSYIVRLSPNERFESYNLVMLFFVLIFLIVKGWIYYGNDIGYISLLLWSSYVSIYTIFIIVFLFRVILIVVWLRWKFEGAVRLR